MDNEPDDLMVDQTIDGETAVIGISGEIDIASRDLVTNAAREAVDAGARRLVLDMSGVTFMDSSGIGAIIAAKAIAPLSLRAPSDTVLRLISATGLTDSFTIEP